MKTKKEEKISEKGKQVKKENGKTRKLKKKEN